MKQETRLIQQSEQALHPDVVALCALLAQIMNRCIKEQDPRIMALIQTPEASTVQDGGKSHAA
ncbi:MAG TPA: hypothetical protein VKV40_14620 [Ktedonobacteraceae bacterium]|jgi:hypothetical protein|nr:hypothetical protein [Ktedonobacteraceae bacterium]